MGYKRIPDKDLVAAVAVAHSMQEAISLLTQSTNSTTRSHFSMRIKALGVPLTHFVVTSNLVPNPTKRPFSVILVRRPAGSRRERPPALREAMLASGVLHKCALCGQGPIRRRMPLRLDIDHIDGDAMNNLIDNLRFLCPSCHTQTPTYGHRSKKQISTCAGCGTSISHRTRSGLCIRCVRHKPKIEWPDPDVLLRAVEQDGFEATARNLGVSSQAIRKNLRKHDLLPVKFAQN
jgi:hypothetical protein